MFVQSSFQQPYRVLVGIAGRALNWHTDLPLSSGGFRVCIH